MRTTIDFGIDLGTTNSVVAVSEAGQVEVIKNNDNQDITPSVVQVLASGAVIVGRKAYEHLRTHDDGNAYEGAKRQMGKRDQRYPFAAAGVSKGPEDLAAEVLKSLRADAEAWAGQPVRQPSLRFRPPSSWHRQKPRSGLRSLQESCRRHCYRSRSLQASHTAISAKSRTVTSSSTTSVEARSMSLFCRSGDGRLLVVDHEGHNILGGRDWDRLCDLIIARLEDQGFQPRSRRSSRRREPAIPACDRRGGEDQALAG